MLSLIHVISYCSNLFLLLKLLLYEAYEWITFGKTDASISELDAEV